MNTSEYNQMTGFLTLLGKELHRFVRLYNQTLIPPIITAVLFILIFGYSLGDRIGDIEGVTYIQFIIPGLVMMSVISAAYANTSSSFFIARFQNSLDELLVSSMSHLEVVLAIVLGGVGRGLVVGVGVMGACILFGHGIAVAHIGVTLGFIVGVAVIFSCMGFISAIWADNFDQLSLFQTYLLTPLIYLGGVFFSVSNLPPVWQSVARMNPVLYFVNGLRYGFLEVSDVNISISLGVTFLLSGVLFWLCVHLYRIGYNIRS
jgi:ABC-2 type transport system permease protein